MPTPSKPFSVLSTERKSHRTKKELKQRRDGEEALITGTILKEKPQVKSDAIAHKEFTRINKLLEAIEKNDAIYEVVINRYCILYSECYGLGTQREYLSKVMQELTEQKNSMFKNDELTGDKLIEFVKAFAQLASTINTLDKLLQAKRKMMLDIEKENVMTVASALRSIPKNTEPKKNALLEAINGS